MDLAIQIVGLLAILFAGRQLWEARQRRRFDTYWQFFTVYSSKDYRRGREAINEIRGELGLSRAGRAEPAADPAETYLQKFHSSRQGDRPAEDESRVREIDERARLRVRFFNTAGTLLDKQLVDEELLLELIGPAFNRDYEIIHAIVEGNRRHYELPVYDKVDVLKERYDSWATKRRIEA